MTRLKRRILLFIYKKYSNNSIGAGGENNKSVHEITAVPGPFLCLSASHRPSSRLILYILRTEKRPTPRKRTQPNV